MILHTERAAEEQWLYLTWWRSPLPESPLCSCRSLTLRPQAFCHSRALLPYGRSAVEWVPNNIHGTQSISNCYSFRFYYHIHTHNSAPDKTHSNCYNFSSRWKKAIKILVSLRNKQKQSKIPSSLIQASQGSTCSCTCCSAKYPLTREPIICCGERVVLMYGRMNSPWVFSA